LSRGIALLGFGKQIVEIPAGSPAAEKQRNKNCQKRKNIVFHKFIFLVPV
jgi:hypothetical protein